jgi:hypothetical protein
MIRHTNIETSRVQRTWMDVLSLWRRASETRIFNEQREAIGRGPNEQASRVAALEIWVIGARRQYEASRDHPSV